MCLVTFRDLHCTVCNLYLTPLPEKTDYCRAAPRGTTAEGSPRVHKHVCNNTHYAWVQLNTSWCSGVQGVCSMPPWYSFPASPPREMLLTRAWRPEDGLGANRGGEGRPEDQTGRQMEMTTPLDSQMVSPQSLPRENQDGVDEEMISPMSYLTLVNNPVDSPRDFLRGAEAISTRWAEERREMAGEERQGQRSRAGQEGQYRGA
jgi:hypothetical protein